MRIEGALELSKCSLCAALRAKPYNCDGTVIPTHTFTALMLSFMLESTTHCARAFHSCLAGIWYAGAKLSFVIRAVVSFIFYFIFEHW